MKMKKMLFVVPVAAALAGCHTCDTCRDLSERLDDIESALNPKQAERMRRAREARLAGRKVAVLDMPVRTAGKGSLASGRVAGAKSVVRAAEGRKADPMRTKAAAMRGVFREVGRTVDAEGGTVTQIGVRDGVVTTNTVPLVRLKTMTGPVKYSKMLLQDNIANLGYWPQVEEMLNSTVLPNGLTLMHKFNTASYFTSDDPYLRAGCEKALELGFTQEQIDALLKASLY